MQLLAGQFHPSVQGGPWVLDIETSPVKQRVRWVKHPTLGIGRSEHKASGRRSQQ